MNILIFFIASQYFLAYGMNFTHCFWQVLLCTIYYVQLAPVNNTMWTLRAGRMRSSQGVWRAGRRAVSYAGRGRPAHTGPGTMRMLLHSGHTSAPPCPVMDTPTRIQKLYPETGTVGEVYWWINKHNQNQVGREDGRDILNLCLEMKLQLTSWPILNQWECQSISIGIFPWKRIKGGGASDMR